MEKPISGRIEFEGVTYSRAVQRFVEKRIHRWLTAQETSQPNDFPLDPADPQYFVTFRKQGPGHTINCNLEVRMGAETWVSFRYGSGPHQALAQCLDHMSRTRGGSLIYSFLPEVLDARRRKVVMIPAGV